MKKLIPTLIFVETKLGYFSVETSLHISRTNLVHGETCTFLRELGWSYWCEVKCATLNTHYHTIQTWQSCAFTVQFGTMLEVSFVWNIYASSITVLFI